MSRAAWCELRQDFATFAPIAWWHWPARACTTQIDAMHCWRAGGHKE
jgi:hypothetical protein